MSNINGHPVGRNTLLRPRGCLLQDGLHHFVSKSDSFRKPRSEVLLNPFETVTIGLEITEGDTIGPRLLARKLEVSKRAQLPNRA